MRFCEGVLNNYKYTQHTIKNLERYGASMNYRLSEPEEQIMSFLWENNGPVKTGMIMDYFWKTVGKDWKRQTLNTLLIRLEDKGVIIRRRGIVEAKYTKEELLHIECQDFVNTKCDGSLVKFVERYFAGETVSKQEAEEIVSLIQQLKG